VVGTDDVGRINNETTTVVTAATATRSTHLPADIRPLCYGKANPGPERPG
jgi:hypothetical protein